MAWRRPLEPPHVEPPAWYRTFDPAAWDVPDGHEQGMIDGCGGYRCWPDSPDSRWRNWPQWLHEQHARRRWAEAQGGYRREHPLLAAQEFDGILQRRADRGSPR